MQYVIKSHMLSRGDHFFEGPEGWSMPNILLADNPCGKGW